MLKYLLLFILYCSASAVYSQHSVMNFSDEFINMNHQSLLLIPFEPHMYQSDINRELYEANGLDSYEIRERFIAGIDQSFFYTFNKKCDVSSFYYLDENNRTQDLSFVYNNRTLEYIHVESTKEDDALASIKSVFKKRKTENARIENGQIVSEIKEGEKYMKAVANEILIDSLRKKFHTNYILFVNELDIKNIYADVYDMSTLNYDRLVKLHYTLYSSNGKILSTGISSTTFPATENDIDNIIKNHFPILAQNIYKDLFPVVAN